MFGLFRKKKLPASIDDSTDAIEESHASEPIEFNCPECGNHFLVSIELAGKLGRCRSCGHRVRVPMPEGVEELMAAPAPPVQPEPAAKHPALSGDQKKLAAEMSKVAESLHRYMEIEERLAKTVKRIEGAEASVVDLEGRSEAAGEALEQLRKDYQQALDRLEQAAEGLDAATRRLDALAEEQETTRAELQALRDDVEAVRAADSKKQGPSVHNLDELSARIDAAEEKSAQAAEVHDFLTKAAEQLNAEREARERLEELVGRVAEEVADIREQGTSSMNLPALSHDAQPEQGRGASKSGAKEGAGSDAMVESMLRFMQRSEEQSSDEESQE
jgi:DNA repair exonuclease SbcCD ATPase subunit/DNA-directed RNA polymerase subunit RPC12/RpoP